MAENPFDPPREDVGVNSIAADEEPASTGPFPYYLPIVQFTLRVLGLYLLVIGVAELAADASAFVGYWRYFGELPTGSADFWGRLAGSLIYFGVGIYLIVGGRWLIQKIFLPARQTFDDELDDEDDAEVGSEPSVKETTDDS